MISEMCFCSISLVEMGSFVHICSCVDIGKTRYELVVHIITNGYSVLDWSQDSFHQIS